MAGWVTFVVAFLVYGVTASSSIGWLDSPEFVATSASLGVAHSPGHPIPALLGHLGTLVPIGDVAFRVNMMSAVMSAGAAVALQAGGASLLRRVAPDLDPRARAVASVAVALAFAFSWAAWFQGVRAEVYALQAMLIVGALASLIAFDGEGDRRWLFFAGLFTGLALANHHFMAIAFLAPAAIAVFARDKATRPKVRAAAITAMLGVLGLAAFLYLPVRAAQHPEVNWGAPHTVERFAWTVSAKAFQRSLDSETHVNEESALGGSIAATIEGATIPMFVLGLIALGFALRKPGWRRLALALAGVAGATVAARALIGFESHTPDHHAYLLPAIAALMLLGLAGIASVCQRLQAEKRQQSIALVVLPVLLVPWQLSRNAQGSSLRGAHAADDVARWELEELPPRAVLMVSYFETSYRMQALRAIEHSRPDVSIVDLGFLTYPGMPEEAKLRDPELAAVIDAPANMNAPLPRAQLAALAPRPVFVQLQPDLDPTSMPHLIPRGAFAELRADLPSAEQRAKIEQSDVADRRSIGARLESPAPGDRIGVRNTLLWHDFNRLRFYCRYVRAQTWRPAAASGLGGKCASTVLPGEPPLPEDRGYPEAAP